MRRAGPLLLGVLVALLAAVALAPPVQAHDFLVSSTPESGATVSEPPDQVSLEFNASIGERFAQVAVVGPDGTTYQVGDPVVEGAVVTQAVADIPAGIEVNLSYRVVSSDGHPIGGTVPFTIAPASADEVGPAAGSEPAGSEPAPSSEPAAGAEAATTPAALTSESSSDGVPTWVLLVGAAVVASLVGLGIVTARRTSSASKHS
jgi:copper resistance protein C